MPFSVNDAVRLIMFVALIVATVGEIILWLLSLGHSSSPRLHRFHLWRRKTYKDEMSTSEHDNNAENENSSFDDDDDDDDCRANKELAKDETSDRDELITEELSDVYDSQCNRSEYIKSNNNSNSNSGRSSSRSKWHDTSWSSAPTLSAAAAETKERLKQKFTNGVSRAKQLVRPLLLRIESELDAESDSNSNDESGRLFRRYRTYSGNMGNITNNNYDENNKESLKRPLYTEEEIDSLNSSTVYSPTWNSDNEHNSTTSSPMSPHDTRELCHRRALVNSLIRNHLRDQPLESMQCQLTLQICTWNVDQTDPPILEQYGAFYEWMLGSTNAQRVMRYHRLLTEFKKQQQQQLTSQKFKNFNSRKNTSSVEEHDHHPPVLESELETLQEQVVQALPDVFVITLQEVDMGGVALVKESTQSSMAWTNAIMNALHNASSQRVRYCKLKVVQLVGLVLMVMVKVEHAEYVSHVRLSLTRTGAMRVLGNKGSVAMRATIYGKRFLFIAAHFVAHKHNEQKRSYNYHAAINDIKFVMPYGTDDESEVLRTFINASLLLLNNSSGDNLNSDDEDGNDNVNNNVYNNASTLIKGQSTWDRLLSLQSILRRNSVEMECKALDEHDYVIFLGDLNSRLHELESYEIYHRLRNGEFDYLLCRDELRQGMVSGNVFDGFQEAVIDFPPTYKYDKNSDLFDTSRKQRDPAWCDRILFRVLQTHGDQCKRDNNNQQEELECNYFTSPCGKYAIHQQNDELSSSSNCNQMTRTAKHKEFPLCSSESLKDHKDYKYSDKGEINSRSPITTKNTNTTATKHNIISPRHIHTKQSLDAKSLIGPPFLSSQSYVDLSHRRWMKLSEVHQVDEAALPHSDNYNETKNSHYSEHMKKDDVQSDTSSSSTSSSSTASSDKNSAKVVSSSTLRKRTRTNTKLPDHDMQTCKINESMQKCENCNKLENSDKSQTPESSHDKAIIMKANEKNNRSNRKSNSNNSVKRRSSSVQCNKTSSSPASISLQVHHSESEEQVSKSMTRHTRTHTMGETTFHAARRQCKVKVIEPRFPMICNAAEVTEYYSVSSLKQSDHRPVAARLEVNVVKLSPELIQGIQEHLRHELKMQSDGRLSWNSCKTDKSVNNNFTQSTNSSNNDDGDSNNAHGNAITVRSADHKYESKDVNEEETGKKSEQKEKSDNDGKESENINLSFTSLTSIDTEVLLSSLN